ncbi:alpha-lactalbumin isoform X2 [Notolabrus celidotus]|uniref:alpha-lactalbumin isoform X2 n=1 Tax=Notolabrus celidotus TaxID=1203425 RepID=UPI0014902414|nr:alpha-lactalbumin isoform X2 [Notolabrus celidotus]
MSQNQPMRGQDGRAPVVCYVEFASGFNTAAVNQLDLQSSEPKEVWKLYGLFQLSNHLVCSEDDDKDLSKNICEMNCNKLVDDNITDDIECLSTVLKAFLKDGWNNKEQLEMIKNIFQERCGDKTSLDYFSDCS